MSSIAPARSAIKFVDPERAKQNIELFDRLYAEQNPPRAEKPDTLCCLWYFVPDHWKKVIHGV